LSVLSVAGNAVRDLGEAELGTLLVAGEAPRKDRLRVLMGALYGLVFSVLLAILLHKLIGNLDAHWGPFEAVLAGAIPFMMLGIAVWHLLRRHYGPTKEDVRKRANDLRALQLTAFLIVAGEGFEFTVLTLDSSGWDFIVGLALAVGLLAVATVLVMIIGKRLIGPLMNSINWLLVAMGAFLLYGAKGVYDERHWQDAYRVLVIVYSLVVLVTIVIDSIKSAREPSKPARSTNGQERPSDANR
jgi:hypothetical protein